MSDMTILEQWRSIAYNQNADKNKLQRFWANYFNIEKSIEGIENIQRKHF